MKKVKRKLPMHDLPQYVRLFLKACDHYHFTTDDNGEFQLSPRQKDMVKKYIKVYQKGVKA